MADWFNVGRMPGDSPITSRQLWFIRKHSIAVLDVLEPRERCSVELMGYEEWCRGLEGFGLKQERRPLRVRPIRRPTKKWFETGFGGRSDG